jgi:hypothetical protein
MTVRFWIAATILLAAIAPGGSAWAAATISKTEIRRDPPKLTDRRLRDLVWEMFKPQDLRRKEKPTRPLTDVTLETRNIGTHVPGLCRHDRLRVDFAPVSRSEEGADAPTRPVGLAVTSYFAFARPPRSGFDELADYRRLPSQGDCGRLPDEAFFVAGDEQAATDGVYLLGKLQQALRESRAVKIECERIGENAFPCADQVKGLAPTNLSSVETCESPDYSLLCYLVDGGDFQVRLVARQRTFPGPPFGEIVSARVEQMIIVADTVRD